MQRVRIGLTGLACVFLLVLLAASLFGVVGGGGVVAPRGQMIDANGTMTANSADPPKEPLAELGVAPGNLPDHPLDNRVVASPAPPRAPVAAR